MTAFRDTITSAFVVGGLAQAPTFTVNGTYGGDKIWDVDILDTASQNDSDTLWSGANIDNIVRLRVTNRTGWNVGISPNGNGNLTLTPGSFMIVSLAGSLSVLQAVEDPLTYIEYELTSPTGTPGKISVEMLGVEVP